MQIKRVTNIPWNGRCLTAFVLLRGGPLANDSIVFPASSYLIHLARSSASENSQQAAASDLKTFFSALENAGVKWDELTQNQMSGYLETTLMKEMHLCSKSIARHCSSLKGMYSYSNDWGLSEHLFDYSYTYFNDQYKEIDGSKHKGFNLKLKKRYINEQLFQVILAHACESPGFCRQRNEIIFEIGYHMGLRAHEVTIPENFKITDLQEKIAISEKKEKLSFSVEIHGKGKKIRTVEVPPALVEKLKIFISGPRSKIPGNQLICSVKGTTLSRSFPTRIFNKAKSTALPRLKEKLKQLEKMEYEQYTINYQSVTRLSFHCLRHTFTTNLVTYCYASGIDPMTYVPNQLGHSHEQTTRQYIDFEATIYSRVHIRERFSVRESDDE